MSVIIINSLVWSFTGFYCYRVFIVGKFRAIIWNTIGEDNTIKSLDYSFQLLKISYDAMIWKVWKPLMSHLTEDFQIEVRKYLARHEIKNKYE